MCCSFTASLIFLSYIYFEILLYTFHLFCGHTFLVLLIVYRDVDWILIMICIGLYVFPYKNFDGICLQFFLVASFKWNKFSCSKRERWVGILRVIALLIPFLLFLWSAHNHLPSHFLRSADSTLLPYFFFLLLFLT